MEHTMIRQRGASDSAGGPSCTPDACGRASATLPAADFEPTDEDDVFGFNPGFTAGASVLGGFGAGAIVVAVAVKVGGSAAGAGVQAAS